MLVFAAADRVLHDFTPLLGDNEWACGMPVRGLDIIVNTSKRARER